MENTDDNFTKFSAEVGLLVNHKPTTINNGEAIAIASADQTNKTTNKEHTPYTKGRSKKLQKPDNIFIWLSCIA